MSSGPIPDLPALLVHPTPGLNAVTAGVWVMSGSAHEAESIAGATHLVEHLTLRCCGRHDRRSLARLVDRLGGDVDAWTGFELMGVSVQTTVDAVDEAIELLIDAVLTPTFDSEDVELERRVSMAELELLRDDPAERVEEGILRAAWGEHPLARPVIGTADSLAALTPEMLRRHHAEMIQPGRMLAAVVGDVDTEHVARLFRRLPLTRLDPAPVLAPLKWLGNHDVQSRNGIDQAHARLAFPAMSSRDPEVMAISVLNKVLGVGASSRLFQRLREGEGLTYDIWSSPVLRRQGGLLEVGWACAPAVFEDVWRVVLEELRRLAFDVQADEVEIAKEGIARGLTIDAELTAARCALEVAETLDRQRRFDPELVRQELSAVTVAEVQNLASRLLRVDRMAAAVCGPVGLEARVA